MKRTDTTDEGMNERTDNNGNGNRNGNGNGNDGQ